MTVSHNENKLPTQQLFPVPLICPSCQKDHLEADEHKTPFCPNCKHSYERNDGFLDLIIGDRFDDDPGEECLCYEEDSNEYTVTHYWIPLFREFQAAQKEPLRILAVGCGTGVEVDLLTEAGFICVGIDCGNRSSIWSRRTCSDHLLLANGMHLPFEDAYFDIAFCGCVFPHVGVVGDSSITTEKYFEDRSLLAHEMTRVVRPDGHIALSSPNRNCPIDIFHGREAGSFTPLINQPGARFLLSLKDYRSLFVNAGCTQASARETEGYWGFVRSKNSWKGLILGIPVRFVFWLTSRNTFRFLRTTPIAPWLVVVIRK